MSEHDKHTWANMYECIDADVRFTLLGDIILNKIGYITGEGGLVQGPDTAIWPKKPDGYYFKLQKEVTPAGIYKITRYVLDHYVDELPGQPLTRYAVIYDPWRISQITILNEDNLPRVDDSRQGKEAAKQALAILTEAAGKDAKQMLDRIFDRRFEEIIGRYVLSGLAIKIDDKLPTIDDQAVESALVEHMLHDIEVLEEEGIKSNESDDKSKKIIISDAIIDEPKTSRRGRFAKIDIFNTVKNTASQLKPAWRNNVSPDQ